MSGLDALPPDQRAVLQLVLRQGRTYGQLADLLKIDPRVVRERARLGAETLVPPPANLDADDRVEIVDYLLGQDPLGRELLDESAPARGWAAELSTVLSPLARNPLPEVTVAGAAPAAQAAAPVAAAPTALAGETRSQTAAEPETPEEAERERGKLAAAAADVRSSRLGGALLIGGIGIFVIILVVVLLGSGSKDDGGTSTPDTTSTAAQTTTTGTTGTTGTSTTASTPKPLGTANLKAAQAGSKAVGVAQLLEQGTTAGFVVAAKGVTTVPNTYHGVWLSGSGVKPLFLGSVRNQDVKTGRISAVAPVPKTIKAYDTMLITQEPITASKKAPTTPGQTVLSGPLKLTGTP